MAKNTRYNKKAVASCIDSFVETYKGAVEDIHVNMFEIDLRYHRASIDYVERCQKAQEEASCKGIPEEPVENVQPPVLLEQTEGIVAYLSSLFLARSPIFTPMAIPEKQVETDLIERVLLSYQNEGSWVAEEIQAYRNVTKHNLVATKAGWRTEALSDAVARPYSVRMDGIDVQTYSLYDCIWDTSVLPKRFQYDGMFFQHNQYYTEENIALQLSRLPSRDAFYSKTLERLIANLSAKDSDKLRGVNASKTHSRIEPLKTLDSLNGFQSGLKSKGAVDWAVELGLEDDAATGAFSGGLTDFDGYKLSETYIRATDKQLGYTTSTSSRYNVYKIISLNDSPLTITKLDLNFFEVILAQGIVDDFGYTTKSIVEPTVMYQDIASSLIRAKLASSRRSIHDRAIFNPAYIKNSDVTSPVDGAKIPIRKSQWYNPNALNEAYREIPFSDRTADTLISDANLFMSTLPSAATGLSEFRRGPVKGNRSKGQFELESAAADGRAYLLAQTLESTRSAKMRKTIRALLLTHTPQENRIKWEELRDHLDFRITDGLVNLGIFEDTGVLEKFTDLASQNPAFTPLVLGIYEHVLSVKTPFNLDQFIRKTEALLQAQQQGNPAQAQAPAGAPQLGDPNGQPNQANPDALAQAGVLPQDGNNGGTGGGAI